MKIFPPATDGVTIDPLIQGGVPCITGTRVSVRLVLRALEQHCDLSEVRIAYPQISSKQAKDALWYAQKMLDRETEGE